MVQETGYEWQTSGIGFADDVNLIDGDKKNNRKNAEELLKACKGIGLAENTEKLSTWKYDIIGV
jgi:hypothetical protein